MQRWFDQLVVKIDEIARTEKNQLIDVLTYDDFQTDDQLKKLAGGQRLNHGEEAVDVGEKLLVEILEVLDGGRKFKLELLTEAKADPDAVPFAHTS